MKSLFKALYTKRMASFGRHAAQVLCFTRGLRGGKRASELIFGPSKAQAAQTALDRTSVFHKEYLGLHDLATKSTKRWVEVAVDPVRVQRGGLK